MSHLRSIIDGKNGTEADVKASIGRLEQNLHNWRATKIFKADKVEAFELKCEVLLYGCEFKNINKHFSCLFLA